MTHVTQSDIRPCERRHWPVVGFGALVIRILQNKLQNKAAGRMACCQNEELMSDLWFDGFPELLEQKQTVSTIYRKHTIGEHSNTLTVREHNDDRLIQLRADGRKRRHLTGHALARPPAKTAA